MQKLHRRRRRRARGRLEANRELLRRLAVASASTGAATRSYASDSFGFGLLSENFRRGSGSAREKEMLAEFSAIELSEIPKDELRDEGIEPPPLSALPPCRPQEFSGVRLGVLGVSPGVCSPDSEASSDSVELRRGANTPEADEPIRLSFPSLGMERRRMSGPGRERSVAAVERRRELPPLAHLPY